MIATSSIKELTKKLRLKLIEQTELSEKFVRNSLSKYGTILDKETNFNIFETLTANDVLLIFELSTRDSTSNVSMTIENSLEYYQSFNLKCVFYGDNAEMEAIKLASRFRSETVLTSFEDMGIYIEKVRDPESINEFVNDTMWLRSDVDISLSCKFKIDQIKVDDDFDTISTIILKEV